jgi:tetratricopeptide (TPR) repeat protein
MYRKGDPAAAKTLLDEVRLRGGKLQNSKDRRRFSATTWDSLEDVYEDCAKLQKDRDPGDAKSWFVLAVETEKNAAQMEDRHLKDVALICDSFGDFEVAQEDYKAAIREYTDAVNASEAMLRSHNDGKPDLGLVTYLIDRGDAELKASDVDAARIDFEESSTLAEKLEDTPENQYQKMVVLERIGGLQLKAKHPKEALDWYRREKKIALALAEKDIHRRQSLPVVYGKVCDALRAQGDTRGEQAELEEQAANFEKWARPNDESDLQEYIKARELLGDFNFRQKDYKAAQISYEPAVLQAQQLAGRWPSASNVTMRWEALYKASRAEEELDEKYVAISYLEESVKAAQDLPASNERRDALLTTSQIHIAQIFEGQARRDDALKAYRETKPTVSKLAAKDCAAHLDEFHQAEFGIIKALVELKRSDEAKAEGRDAMQFVETNCADVEKAGNADGKASLAQFWGGLGYSFTMAGADALALTCDEKGLSIDGSQVWIKVNVAHAYLFTGRVEEAKRLYNEIKSLKWNDRPLMEDIRDDFKELRSLGRDHPAMDSILSMLVEARK